MDENNKKLKIMNFIYNALENGWEVKKKESNSYVFRKRHNGEKKVFMENYLENFIYNNFKDS
jgi:hypothetical protein